MRGSTSPQATAISAVHLQGFRDELMRLGYSAVAVRVHVRLAVDLGRWLDARRVALRDFDRKRVAAFLRHRRQAECATLFTKRALAPLLTFLRRTGAVPPDAPDHSRVGRLVEDYAAYLVDDRGLAASTVHVYTDFSRRFIAEQCPRLDWQRMTCAGMTRFVLQTAQRMTPAGAKFYVKCLRSLLRFLHVRGLTTLDLTSGIPGVAGWRMAGIPKGIDAWQVDRVLASFGDSPVGLRDAAVVRLMVRLGLRAGEVTALDLEDVDWRAGELAVRGKSRRDTCLPLPPDVGGALAAYLKRGRPRSSARALILRNQAPFLRLSRNAVCAVARRALAAAGVRGGAHRFRHTAATQMLGRGASLSEIAHVLRHRSVNTTAIYAKVDLATLSQVVRRWPEGT